MTRAAVVKALLCCLTVVAAALGCTATPPGASSPTPSRPSAPASSPPAPADITVAVFGPRGALDGYDRLAEAFEQSHPHVSVEVRRHAGAEDVVADVRGDDPPDVFLMDPVHLASLVQEQRVRPVDELLGARNVDFGDGFQRGGLTAFAANDALQCMPHDVSPVVVYYNEDLVDLAGLVEEGEQPPNALDGWTWEMFETAARQAARRGVHGVYLEPSLTSLAPFVWSAGADIVDDPGAPTTLTLSDPDTADALARVLAVVRDTDLTPAPGQLARKDAVTRFTEGRLGMILGTRALTPPLREKQDLRFDVMPLPTLGRQRTVAEMTGYCISAETASVDAAADFVTFAVGREGATITAAEGYVVPSNLEVANSPVFVQQSRQPESSFVFNEGVRRAQHLPSTPAWPELVDELEQPLHRLFYDVVIDLDSRLEAIDRLSARVLAPEEQTG